MDDKTKLKQDLYEACAKSIAERIENIQNRFRSIEEARNNESKSSVGDKHETGRAMMQLEEENISVQLTEANKTRSELERIDWRKVDRETVGIGNLVFTNKGNYFLAIGLGKIKLKDQAYYCISIGAPIAKQLLQKRVGDTVVFNGREISIEAIY